MIPESSGATPFGIFLLADEYLHAARMTWVPHGTATYGPTRLLAYHSCELFLKAHLRSHGLLIVSLRAFQHDLPAMLAEAIRMGLQPRKSIIKALSALEENSDYVRVRYSLSTEAAQTRAEQAVNLATKVRESVRLALDFDEFGTPKGELWKAPLPPDYGK
ncbi:MAG TPA: HEPN domain-containing protein [Pseudorhizobium sp.]|nr:HEPN domain-containing protein [Pseudorhizobium sp.]